MHQNMHTLSETLARSACSTRLTFACVFSARRISRLEPHVTTHVRTYARCLREQKMYQPFMLNDVPKLMPEQKPELVSACARLRLSG